MNSIVSLTQKKYFFDITDNNFKIPITKVGTDNCSVSILLADSGLLQPSAVQYVGIERVLQWLPNEQGIKYAVFDILPTANQFQYLAIALTNFLRCKPHNISQAIAAIAKPKYQNYPTIFGGWTPLSSVNMQRDVSITDKIYTTTYLFKLPSDAVLGEIRDKAGDFIEVVYRRIQKLEEWTGVIAIMDSEPILDESLEIHVLLCP